MFAMLGFKSLFSQKILSDIDKYILSELIENNLKYNISELIEKDQELNVIRKWEFDFEGKIIRELDLRESGWSSSIGNKEFMKSKTKLKEFAYDYLENGKINEITQREITDQEEINILRKFEYKSKNEVRESWKLNRDNEFTIEFEEVTKFNKGMIDSSTFMSRTYIGDSYSEFTKTNTFEYDSNNTLKGKKGYFTTRVYPDRKNKGLNEYQDSKSCYLYDQLGKLMKITEYEINQKEEEKMIRLVSFLYNKNSHLIDQINVSYSGNYSPKELEYKINYTDGKVTNVMINDKIFFYELKIRN